MFIDVVQEWRTNLTNSIDRFQLDIESIEAKIKYFKTGHFEEKSHGVFEDAMESFP